MQLHQTKNARDFAIKAKEIFVDEIKQIIAREEQAIIAIPGGTSVQGMLKLLQSDDLDWSKVHLFMIDERMVSIEDPLSNFKQAKDLLLNRVPAINAHPFRLEKGAYAYTEELSALTVGEKAFDLVLVAAGEDGHIGGLYPSHSSVKHIGKEYFSFDDSPKPPAHRVTASAEIIAESNVVILLFASDAKKNAFQAFQNHNTSEIECPAKLVLHAKKPQVITQFM